MSLTGKIEFLQEIVSPGNVFLEIFGSKKDCLPMICPDKVPLIELLDGNWGDAGCKIIVHYLLGEAPLKLLTHIWERTDLEETVEAVDEKNKSITYNLYGGDLMKLYKTLRITFQVTSKGEKNFLKWTYEYERLNSDIPPPEKLKNFAYEVTNMIDAHYVELKNNGQGQVREVTL